jgi:AcrR family transcriptional regulator
MSGSRTQSGSSGGARLATSADPRAVRTRKALRDALLALLETHSFDEITPRDISAKAGVARASFYLHHASKESMLDELAKDEIIKLYEHAQQVLDQMGSRVAALALCEYIERERTLWSALLNGGAGDVIRAEMLRLSRHTAAERAFPGDRLPSDLSTAYSTSGMVEIIAWWLRQNSHYSTEFVADLMVELVFNPIKTVSTSPNLKFS